MKVSIAFTLSCFQHVYFIAVDMYPVYSRNYSLNDFGILSEEIAYWKEKGFTPFLGGDLNARLGDLNKFAENSSLKWKYSENADATSNSHGSLLQDLCEHNDILSINHCRYYNKSFDGKSTFYKGGKQ